MAKQKLIYGIVGLIFGMIIGFSLANSLNRNVRLTKTENVATDAPTSPNLPPEHPPIPGNDNQTSEAALPQITAAIDKARQNPNDYEAQMTAADLYYQIQRFEDAAKFYEQANKLRPAEIEPLAKLGHSNFDAEKYEEAAQWYVAVLQKTPKDLNVRTDYALTFFLRKPRDLERAIKEYLISLEIDPNHELSLQNLAIAYKEKNDTENFRQTLSALAKVNPNNPAVKEFGQTK